MGVTERPNGGGEGGQGSTHHTPPMRGKPESSFRATAEPITSARSVDSTAICRGRGECVWVVGWGRGRDGSEQGGGGGGGVNAGGVGVMGWVEVIRSLGVGLVNP